MSTLSRKVNRQTMSKIFNQIEHFQNNTEQIKDKNAALQFFLFHNLNLISLTFSTLKYT